MSIVRTFFVDHLLEELRIYGRYWEGCIGRWIDTTHFSPVGAVCILGRYQFWMDLIRWYASPGAFTSTLAFKLEGITANVVPIPWGEYAFAQGMGSRSCISPMWLFASACHFLIYFLSFREWKPSLQARVQTCKRDKGRGPLDPNQLEPRNDNIVIRNENTSGQSQNPRAESQYRQTFWNAF